MREGCFSCEARSDQHDNEKKNAGRRFQASLAPLPRVRKGDKLPTLAMFTKSCRPMARRAELK